MGGDRHLDVWAGTERDAERIIDKACDLAGPKIATALDELDPSFWDDAQTTKIWSAFEIQDLRRRFPDARW